MFPFTCLAGTLLYLWQPPAMLGRFLGSLLRVLSGLLISKVSGGEREVDGCSNKRLVLLKPNIPNTVPRWNMPPAFSCFWSRYLVAADCRALNLFPAHERC